MLLVATPRFSALFMICVVIWQICYVEVINKI